MINAANYDEERIDALASAELLQWFVRDNLAASALERAGHDPQGAIGLLKSAIAELENREASQPSPPAA